MSSVHNGKPSSHANNLLYTIIIIFVAMIVEIVGGIVSNSLALLSNAGHLFTDLAALALSWSAYKVAMRKSDSDRSYGYHRFQVVAAFTNGITLFIMSGFITYESIKRFIYPVTVKWDIMFAVAIFELIANIISFLLLYRKNEDNLNVKSAVLHILGDLLGSISAIVGSILIKFTEWQAIDPILSTFVSFIILNSAYKMIKSSGHILLEGTPENLSTEDIKTKLHSKISQIIDVHHIHIWSLTNQYPIITMHVRIKENCDYTNILYSIKKFLNDEFDILHATVEIEYEECADNKLLI